MSYFQQENEELLDALQEDSTGKTKQTGPKRGSKDELIAKIFQICDECNLVCECTKTDLKRMNKKKLQQCLAEYIEKGMKAKIKQQANVESIQGASDLSERQLIAVGTLRMLHDSVASLCERGVDTMSPYTIEGFAESFRKPEIRPDLDECLLAIAKEMDVMEYIDSPYMRLGMIWTSGICKTLRHKQSINFRNSRKSNVNFRKVESRQFDEI